MAVKTLTSVKGEHLKRKLNTSQIESKHKLKKRLQSVQDVNFKIKQSTNNTQILFSI
jgi:hypothetical protein